MMVAFILFMIFKAHQDVIDYRSIVDIRLPEEFNDFRVFFISDIHRRRINSNTLKTIKKNINIIVIGGDLTEKGVPLQRTRANLKLLKQFNVPIYFVWGNNDSEVNTEQFQDVLYEENVIILEDSYINMIRNNQTLSLIGFDYHEEEKAYIKLNWEQLKGNYCLLLTHVPHSFYNLEPYIRRNIHTVLAGHTHGGQIRIFNLGFYQRGGLHIFEKTNIFISEGYGYTFLPFRLQTNAECHILTFKKQ